MIGKVRDRNVVTYGFNLQADICGVNIQPDAGGNVFDVIVRRRGQEDRRIEGVRLPMPGRHNVQNALAAIAVSIEMGCPDEVICNGFSTFGGVRRRFEPWSCARRSARTRPLTVTDFATTTS